MSSTSLSVGSDPQLRLTAKLTDNSGSPIPNKTIYFYKSSDGVNWSEIGTGVTDSNGMASVTDSLPSTKTYYRAEFKGDDQYEPSSATTVYTPSGVGGTTSKSTGIPWWVILLFILLLFLR